MSPSPILSYSRRSGFGAHQFTSPKRRMTAGTTSDRTMVASMATAIARPMPMALMITTSARPKAMNTVNMMAAAPVINRPVRSRPLATAAVLLPRRTYSSCMRLTSRTS